MSAASSGVLPTVIRIVVIRTDPYISALNRCQRASPPSSQLPGAMAVRDPHHPVEALWVRTGISVPRSVVLLMLAFPARGYAPLVSPNSDFIPALSDVLLPGGRAIHLTGSNQGARSGRER